MVSARTSIDEFTEDFAEHTNSKTGELKSPYKEYKIYFYNLVLPKYEDSIRFKNIQDNLCESNARVLLEEVLERMGKRITHKKNIVLLIERYASFLKTQHEVSIDLKIPAFPLLAETERYVAIINSIQERRQSSRELAEKFWVTERSISEYLRQLLSDNEYEGIRIGTYKVKPPISIKRNRYGFHRGTFHLMKLALNINQLVFLVDALTKVRCSENEPYILPIIRSIWMQLGEYAKERITEVADELDVDIEETLEAIEDDRSDFFPYRTEEETNREFVKDNYDFRYYYKNYKIIRITHIVEANEQVVTYARVARYNIGEEMLEPEKMERKEADAGKHQGNFLFTGTLEIPYSSIKKIEVVR